MLNIRISSILFLLFSMSVIVALGCSSDKSNGGVARIDRSEATTDIQIDSKVGMENRSPLVTTVETPESGVLQEELTDEDIATKFAACMRDKGFDTPDPELNADGTVNTVALRTNIVQDPKFDYQDPKTRRALDGCLPLLQGATFAQGLSAEDEIALQDNLLTLAQCLRDEGIDVDDPDFSNGIRSAMGTMFQSADIRKESVQAAVESCAQETFGAAFGPRR